MWHVLYTDCIIVYAPSILYLLNKYSVYPYKYPLEIIVVLPVGVLNILTLFQSKTFVVILRFCLQLLSRNLLVVPVKHGLSLTSFHICHINR